VREHALGPIESDSPLWKHKESFLKASQEAITGKEPPTSTDGRVEFSLFRQGICVLAAIVQKASALILFLEREVSVFESVLISERCARPRRTTMHATTLLSIDCR
jgi:hypothetical protein